MQNTINRRAEPRYSLRDIYSKYMSCSMCEDDSHSFDVQILEFSKNGVKIQSPVHKELDSELDCVISLPKLYPKVLKTKIKVRYVYPEKENGYYILGAMIIDPDKSYVARVFTKIIEFITTRNGILY